MKNIQFKSFTPHAIALLIFLVITSVYFSPIFFDGKKLKQSDITHFKGMSKEIVDHRELYDEEPLWTNSMFSGMPAYQISVLYTGNLIKKAANLFQLFLPSPSGFVFLYLLGFYFLLVSLGINYRLAILGAIAFAFSSYFFIIIEAGHNTKAHAIGYLAPVLASVLMVFRGKKILLGGVLTALTTSLMLNANHFQITYYLVLVFLILGFVKFYEAYKEKSFASFFKKVGILLVAGALGLLTNISSFMTTSEYGAESMRGKSDLTSNIEDQTTGLKKSYATQWSYGIAESFTLLIPNFHGGSSSGELDTDSETFKAFGRSNQAKKIIKRLPLYWGDQPFTSGPVYAGAVVFLLFIMGLFLINKTTKLWVLISFILMLMLSWGKNFMPLTDFFLDYIPAYNKFRAVSTTLVIVELLIPFVAILGLQKLIDSNKEQNNKMIKLLKTSVMSIGGLCLFFALFPTAFFDFKGLSDSQYPSGFPIDAIIDDRISLFVSDSFRSLVLILIAALSIFLFLSNVIKKNHLILALGLLIIGDMWSINKRYLDNDDFVSKRKIEQPYQLTSADKEILKDKDPNFRVYNTTVSPFNDASTSYFHKSIGGYHGAKLKRYQEIIDRYLSLGKLEIFNMLNTKYFIVRNQNNLPIVQPNPNAYGNAWFVKEILSVENADQEIDQIGKVNLTEVAVVNENSQFSTNFTFDSLATINLINYKANKLEYISKSSTSQLAVFSEIFYDKGWNAYINGELVPHFRANFILRALNIPKGENNIVFKFEPKTYRTGEQISLASSITLILLILGVAYRELK